MYAYNYVKETGWDQLKLLVVWRRSLSAITSFNMLNRGLGDGVGVGRVSMFGSVTGLWFMVFSHYLGDIVGFVISAI